MADFGQFAGGAIGGAAAGSAFGPVGTVIGGVLGGFASLFGDSPEEQRRKRKDALIAAIRRIQMEKTTIAAKEIGDLTQRNVASSRAAATRQAAAQGINAEPSIATAEGRALDTGGSQLQASIRDINKQAGDQEYSAEADFSQRPIEPSVSDYILGLGGAAGQIKHNIDMANQLAAADASGGMISTTAKAPIPQLPNAQQEIFGQGPTSAPVGSTNYNDYLSKASASMSGIPDQTFLPTLNRRKIPGMDIVESYRKLYRP